jgi:hypothetical protein
MADADGFDPRFSLPAIDDAPLTEAGVILLGLDAERLLAGLGLATPADDPGQVALAVDRAGHGAAAHLPAAPHPAFEALLVAGAQRWRAACRALDAAGWQPSRSGSLRQSWAHTLRLVDGVDVGPTGPALRAYLAACWLRRAAVDSCAASRPATGSGVS